MMMKLCTQVNALILFLLITGCDQISNEQSTSDDSPLVGKLYRDRSLFVYSYDKAFAERFSLPQEKALVLSSGLKAIAIEAKPTLGIIRCYVHLYLDDSIKPLIPMNQANYTWPQFIEAGFTRNFNSEDMRWLVDSITSNRAFYREKSGSGFTKALKPKQYKQNFLPSLSLLTFYFDCSELGIKNIPAELIFQKAGTEAYILGYDDPNNMHNENTYYFDIPPKLQQHFDQYARFIGDYNVSSTVNRKINMLKPTVDYP